MKRTMLARLSAAVICSAALWQPAAAQSVCNDMLFTDVTLSAGITHQYVRPTAGPAVMAGGAVAADVNGDGWLDIYVAQGDGPNLLYINDTAGGFTNEAAARGAELAAHNTIATSAADFDNDGDIDLAASITVGQSRVLINDGTGNFTTEIVLPFPTDKTQSSSWGDIDNDGFLELAIGQWEQVGATGPQGMFLYKNDGGTTLTNYEFRNNPSTDVHVFTPRFADLNGDRMMDMHVGSDFGASMKFMNTGGDMFDGSPGHGGANDMGHTLGDYDFDGDLDIVVTDISTNGGNQMYANDGQGAFTNVTATAGIGDGWWGWAASFGDLDNDGDLDIYHVNGFQPEEWRDKPSRLFMSNGDGTFDEVAACANAEAAAGSQGRGMHLFDYDNDGDLDIFIVNNANIPAGGDSGSGALLGDPVLLRNDTPANGRHWLKVTLDGTPPMHRNGIGSRVYVTTGTKTQMHELHASTNFLSQDAGHIAHFGLNTSVTADEVRAEWVTGDATVFANVAADQAISMPSPTATVSSRTLTVGEDVTATSNETAPVEWEIDGNILVDPATTSFATAGTKELKLLVYDAGQTQVVRTELIRVEVSGAAGEPDLTSPAPGSTLPSGTVNFSWTSNGASADDWQLLVGSVLGGSDYFDSGSLPSTTTAADVAGLPEDGSAIHVTLRWTDDAVVTEKNYLYTAASDTGEPAMLSPVPGGTLAGSTETFSWSAQGAAVTKWRLVIGTTQNGSDIYVQGLSAATTSIDISGLPTDGSTVYVKLRWKIDGVVGEASYTYTASTGTPGNEAPVVTISTPATGSVFDETDTVSFAGTATDTEDGDLSSSLNWVSSIDGDLGTAATLDTTLSVGTHVITASVADSGGQSGQSTVTVTVQGEGGGPGTPTIISPAPGSILTGDTMTLEWSAEGTNVSKWRVLVGTSAGGRNILDTGGLAPGTTSTVVSGLPMDGSAIHVTLRWKADGQNDDAMFVFIAATP